MKSIPIIGKFLILIACFGVFVLGIAVFTNRELTSVDTEYHRLLDETKGSTFLARANRSMFGMRGAVADLLIASAGDSKRMALAELDKSRSDFVQQMDAAAVGLPDKAAEIRAYKERGLGIVAVQCAKAIEIGSGSPDAAALQAAQKTYLADCSPQFYRFSADLVAFNEAELKETAQDALITSTGIKATIQNTYLLITGSLALVMLLSFLAIRSWVVKPIRGLSDTMTRLAEGDLAAEVAGAARRDEVGMMARSVQVFKEAGIEKKRIEAMQAAAAQEQAAVIAELSSGLSSLANGDLTRRITRDFAGDYRKLRDDFNAAMTQLTDAFRNIAESTRTVCSGTQEISTASNDLSRRTEQQASSLEETAAALHQITDTMKKSADGTKQAKEVASAAVEEAQRGGAIVRKAVTAMGEIKKSSDKISQIISVVDEIAFQTNLHALNAGVEAARAGDAGKGFAVVASEVRALAQRSADAAKEIKGLISESTRQVGDGVDLVGQTGRALSDIEAKVSSINDVVTEIAASMVDQSTSLQEVNVAVNEMDQVTQQNAAMSEESTAACKSLALESEQLTELVTRFVIDDASSDRMREALKAAAPHAFRAPSLPLSKPRRPSRAAAPTGRALAMVAGGDVEWKEF